MISSWQEQLRTAVRDTADLLERVELGDRPPPLSAAGGFPLRVPQAFLRRIEPGNPQDPLLRQVLPLAEEDREVEGFGPDPLAEAGRQLVPGVLSKYPGRVLLVATAVCAIHCRYCFRRHFPYADSNPARDNWRPALQALREDTSISEVILSGGDPLSLSDNKLGHLLRQLEGIPHLRRLRIHTRMPVVLPERVTDSLVKLLQRSRLRTVVVIHANHAREIDTGAGAALAALDRAGLPLLNQAVLLRGVNDDAGTLEDLSERLFEYRVLPYYLHLLDRVAGAAHFEVPEAEARSIMQELRTRLPGYLLPRLVREEAGELSKTPVD